MTWSKKNKNTYCVNVRFTSIIQSLIGAETDKTTLCFPHKPYFHEVLTELEKQYPKLSDLRRRGFDILFIINGVMPHPMDRIEDSAEIVVIQPASGGDYILKEECGGPAGI